MASMPAGVLILVCWVSLGVYWNIRARSIKSAAEQQNLAARLARMPVCVGFVNRGRAFFEIGNNDHT